MENLNSLAYLLFGSIIGFFAAVLLLFILIIRFNRIYEEMSVTLSFIRMTIGRMQKDFKKLHEVEGA